MGDVLTEGDPGAAEQEGGTVQVHADDIGERIQAAKARDEARAEAEEGENGNGDTDEPSGEGEGEGEGDPPSGTATALTKDGGPELPPFDPATKLCPVCEGWGIVRTHSQVDGHLDRRCDRCQGAGYLERRPDPEAVPVESDWRAPTPNVNY